MSSAHNASYCTLPQADSRANTGEPFRIRLTAVAGRKTGTFWECWGRGLRGNSKKVSVWVNFGVSGSAGRKVPVVMDWVRARNKIEQKLIGKSGNRYDYDPKFYNTDPKYPPTGRAVKVNPFPDAIIVSRNSGTGRYEVKSANGMILAVMPNTDGKRYADDFGLPCLAP